MGTSTRRRVRRHPDWNMIGAVAGVIAVVATIYFGVASLNGNTGGSNKPTAAASEVATQSRDSSQCVDSSGSPSSCADPDSWLITTASPCTKAEVLRFLAVAGERQLDIATIALDERCLARPGEVGRRAGATSVDLQELGQGASIPRLSLCLSTNESVVGDVACSAPHWGELVGGTRSYNGRDSVNELCLDDVRKYTQRLVGEGMDPLSVATVAESRLRVQCVVHLADNGILVDSVWHLAGAPIPTQR